MRKSATGAMLGLAIGDALGYPTEFDEIEHIAAWCPDWRELPLPSPALVTDDTQMTLALARALRTTLADGGPFTAAALEGPAPSSPPGTPRPTTTVPPG